MAETFYLKFYNINKYVYLRDFNDFMVFENNLKVLLYIIDIILYLFFFTVMMRTIGLKYSVILNDEVYNE